MCAKKVHPTNRTCRGDFFVMEVDVGKGQRTARDPGSKRSPGIRHELIGGIGGPGLKAMNC